MLDAKVQSAETPKPVSKGSHLLSMRQAAPRMVILTLFGFTALITAAQPTHAATVGTTIGGTPFANLCTAGVTLPTLTPITNPVVADTTGLLSGTLNTLGLGGLGAEVSGLDGVVNGLTTSIDNSVITPLNGAQLSLGALGNNVTANAALSGGNCNVSTTGVAVTNSQGITIGGGQISGLGGASSASASAGDLSAIAFGNGSNTLLGSVNAIAVGTNSSAVGTGSVALGANTVATAPGGVALGTGSTVTRGAITVAVADPTALASAPTTVTTTTGAVSVGSVGGERQIVNVAAGTNATDAVNVGQITPLTAAINTQVAQDVANGTSVAAALGGGATYNAATGAISNPSYTVGGAPYTSVGAALTAQNTISGNTGAGLASALGGGSTYTAATGAVTAPAYSVDGTVYTNIGSALAASNANAPVKYSTVLTPTVANNGAPTQDVTLVGASALAPVGLHNVAAGALLPLSSDAVNGSQLYATGSTLAAALGGTTTFNTATGGLSAPSFAVGGVAYPSVGAALTAESGIVGLTGASLATTLGGGAAYTAATGVLTNPSYTIDGQVYTNIGSALTAAASAGPVQYSNTGTPTLGNGGTPTQSETLVGAAGGVPVALHNLAPGSLAALSTDAVNGGQINTTAASVAATIGGGTTFNATTGTLTGTSFTVGGLPYTTVNAAITAQNAITGATGASLAANLGGGSLYNAATGTISTPSLTVDGHLYTDVGSAVLAAASDGPVQYSNAGTPTIGNGGTPTQSETLVGALAGSPVALHNLAAGSLAAASTDAINGAQLYATGATLAADLGGGATFSTTTGLVSAPSYTVGGVNFSTVGGAIAAQNTISHNSEAGLTAALGGGASYNTATGAVTGPTYTVGGNTYANVGAAIDAAAAGVGSPVQYSTALAPTTPNGGAPSQDVTLVGAIPAPVGLHNVAAGALTGSSTDAVNGSQLYAAGESTAMTLGGGASFNTLTGLISSPSYTVGGLTYGNVGLAIAAQNTISSASEAGLTTALGGGASYNAANGTVTAPSYTVGGNVYTNVGAAIDAAAAGVGSPVQYSTALAPTTPSGGVPSQDVTLVGAVPGLAVGLHNVAAGGVAPLSTDAVNG
ncbi:MAG: beta strand repeat-containing protein, partial [Caulobacteraceae bacterium]